MTNKPPQTTTCGQCNTVCTIPTPQGWICKCGQTQIFSDEYRICNLSNQAKWYFRGSFPVYERPAVGHAKVEPTAMQELVKAGLCYFIPNSFPMGAMWTLTPLGVETKKSGI